MDGRIGEVIPASVMMEEATETWVRFRMPCGCHTPDHDLTIDMEYDSIVDMTSLRFYYKVCTRIYKGWWKELFHRFSLTWRLWKRGYIETDGEYLFPSEESVSDLIVALIHSYSHLIEKKDVKRRRIVQQEVYSYEDTTVTD